MATKRSISAQDLYALNWVSDPTISSTGEVAFVHTSIEGEKKDYRSQIHLILSESTGSVPFTYGEKDASPAWSPDGSRLAFLRTQEQNRQIWMIPRHGGEARQLTHTKRGVGSFTWSPDGRFIAFTSRISDDTERDQMSKEDEKKRYSEQVRVVDRTRSKSDGEGLWDERHSHLFVLDLASSSTIQLTQGSFDVMEAVWSPDSENISLIAKILDDRSEDDDLLFMSDIFTVSRNGGEIRKLTDSTLSIFQANYSPDGSTIAFYGHDRSFAGATQTRIYTMPASGGEINCLTTNFDRQIGNAGVSDMRSHPHTPAPLFSADGASIYALVSNHGSVHVYRFSLTGHFECVTTGDREIYQFAVAPNDQYLVVASTESTLPGDLYRVDLNTSEESRMTAVNDSLSDQVEMQRPEEFWFETSDGWNVQGWLLKPVGFEEGKHYPAVLEVHGGPHSMYSHSFFHEFQLLAAQGYAVIYTNPRGGYGYGQQFVDACRGDYGGRDYQDLMEAVDYVVSTYPFVDETRLGVTGGSYGGFMTNWIVGHTNRFQAAVTQRSISNWLSFYGVSDIGFFFTEWEIDGNPWRDVETLWKHSPLAYVEKVETPLLILHGEQDLRCPIEQAEQLFVALKRLGKKTQLVRFPDASHELSRSGNPSLRVERLNRITGWLNDHIDRSVR